MTQDRLRILLLSRYAGLGPSSRVRFYQFLPALEAQGIKTTVRPLMDASYLADIYADRPVRRVAIGIAYLRRLSAVVSSRHFDLVWLEGELWPRLPPWGEIALSAINKPMVVDYDDAVFHRYDRHPRRLVRDLLGRKIDTVMAHATAVTVGNRYLADRARQAGARSIEYVPSVVDLCRYQNPQPATNDTFTIGWIGTPTSTHYLEVIQPALEEVCRRGPTRIVLVGSGPFSLPNVPVVSVDWTEKDEVRWIQQFDVGIMPLDDDPIARGKSGYKLIQYMACGRPAVASPVGANADILEDVAGGILASTTDEWVAALERLRSDVGLRQRLGANGREAVVERYSLQAVAPKLISLLRGAVAGNRP